MSMDAQNETFRDYLIGDEECIALKVFTSLQLRFYILKLFRIYYRKFSFIYQDGINAIDN